MMEPREGDDRQPQKKVKMIIKFERGEDFEEKANANEIQ